jgi:hypothetical protein
VVPVQLVIGFAQRNLLDGEGIVSFIRDPTTSDTGSDNAQALAQVLSIVALVFVMPLVIGAVSRVVAASYLGDEPEPGPALRATLRRTGPLLGAWFLVLLLCASPIVVGVLVAVLASTTAGDVVGVLLILLGVPLVVLLFPLFVAVPSVVVVEELGPVRSVRRSVQLLKRRYGGVLGISLLAAFLAYVLGQVLSVLPSALGLLLGGDRGGWLLIAIGGALSWCITWPFLAITTTLLYFDARIRHEGFDLQVMAAGVARGAGT